MRYFEAVTIENLVDALYALASAAVVLLALQQLLGDMVRFVVPVSLAGPPLILFRMLYWSQIEAAIGSVVLSAALWLFLSLGVMLAISSRLYVLDEKKRLIDALRWAHGELQSEAGPKNPE